MSKQKTSKNKQGEFLVLDASNQQTLNLKIVGQASDKDSIDLTLSQILELREYLTDLLGPDHY